MADLVIRNGTVVDGTGADPFEADVAIDGGKIVALGEVAVRGREEIDARGLLVTPGFIDPHTHYDGQATWSSRITPSSWNGVTTTLFGNCGVGFAPCKPSQREMLVKLMEGVEDIPEVVLTEGLPWNWQSFPDFLDALDARPYDMDRLAALRSRLEDSMKVSGGVVIGKDAPRLPTIGAVALPGGSSASLLVQLDLAGIAVSAGSACSSGKMKASDVLAAMQVPEDMAGGFIRVSFGPHTSEADVDRFVDEWQRIASRAQAA